MAPRQKSHRGHCVPLTLPSARIGVAVPLTMSLSVRNSISWSVLKVGLEGAGERGQDDGPEGSRFLPTKRG